MRTSELGFVLADDAKCYYCESDLEEKLRQRFKGASEDRERAIYIYFSSMFQQTIWREFISMLVYAILSIHIFIYAHLQVELLMVTVT